MTENSFFVPKRVQEATVLSLSDKYALKNTFLFIEDTKVNLDHALYWAKLYGDPVLVTILEKMSKTCENILVVKK